MSNSNTHDILGSIAVIGMAGRFPKARNLEAFWENLKNGVEAITFLTDEEVEASGIDPSVYKNPNFVKSSGGVLEDVELFDASFFEYTPREAEAMDPQQRLFLECAWETLENAGYAPEKYDGSIGIFAGVSMNSYLFQNLYTNPDLMRSLGGFNIMVSNDKDFLATRISYKLNLRGPGITMQTACSTGLVVISQACQSLLNYQCDMALAGGVSVSLPQKMGYLYQQGGIGSPDGHCRAFDENAAGTVGGNGLGIVLLKRLSDALEDGDDIDAVIRGFGMNNDGSMKIGFTAPSIDGQAEAIAMAHAIAGVSADTISYIESHGTGTQLGDPIEIAALTKAFRNSTDKKGYCAIGSLKTNIGHLDAAAGLGGFIKTVLALKNKQIPPSLNFEKPNPQIDFANSPFYVNNKLSTWNGNGNPLRAGVSSFGIGGTNAHIVVEEAPARPKMEASQGSRLLTLSAKSAQALDKMQDNLANHLAANPEVNLTDVDYTLQIGRASLKHRKAFVCNDIADAVKMLKKPETKRFAKGIHEPGSRDIAFMFPGQGSQYVNMGKEIYDTEPVYRETFDKCCALLQAHLQLDLKTLIFLTADNADDCAEKLKQTAITQPALFVVEYAMAKLWQSWGVQPQALIGHSIGEYVAACLAGVFSLEDALKLVALRGRLMQSLPSGSMLSIPLPAADVAAMLDVALTVATINAPNLCVVSGSHEDVDKFEKTLIDKSINVSRLHTSHAFHSSMMDPILKPFIDAVASVKRNAPVIPFVSNVSGNWISAEQAVDPEYWAQHLRQAVKFSEGVSTLLKEPSRILVEVGPGRTLSSLAGMCLLELRKQMEGKQAVLTSMRHPGDKISDREFLLTTIGKLWINGKELDWNVFYGKNKGYRIPLPTYPFDRQRYWVEPNREGHKQFARKTVDEGKKADIADWFYLPIWQQTPSLASSAGKTKDQQILVFNCPSAFRSAFEDFGGASKPGILVEASQSFAKNDANQYEISVDNEGDYQKLFNSLANDSKLPEQIIYFIDEQASAGEQFFRALFLCKAISKQGISSELKFDIVSNSLQQITGMDKPSPNQSTILGLCKVIPQEHLNIRCRMIDLSWRADVEKEKERSLQQLTTELVADTDEFMIGYRGNSRWTERFEPIQIPATDEPSTSLTENGTYLITGGLGRIGFVVAKHLAESVKAKICMVSRGSFPLKADWQCWLQEHAEDDSTATKIRQLRELEKQGSEVMICSADVANVNEIRKVVEQTEATFGRLNGVFHAAGVLVGGAFKPITELQVADCDQQFHAKIGGAIALQQVLADKKPDFCMLFSSISAQLGGLGFAAYAASNSFMDVFASLQNEVSDFRWTSVNWDAWNFDMKKEPNRTGQSLMELAMNPDEGGDVLGRILNHPELNQIVASTGDLQARIDKWVKLETVRSSQKGDESKTDSQLYARPELDVDYAAPENEVEQSLASIWQELFGLEKIGVKDNFFELGGHSLLATALVSRIRDTFEIELSLHDFFEKPTISELCDIILEKMIGDEDSDTLNQLLEQIEGS